MNGKVGAYVGIGFILIFCVIGIRKPEDIIKALPTQWKIFGVNTDNPPQGLLTALQVIYTILIFVLIGIALFFVLPS